jgi:hypothetical protein
MTKVFGWLLLALSLVLTGPVRANDDDGAPVAPRAAVEIQGVGVVLIVTNGKLHAFVDRVADNVPLDNAGLIVALAEGRPLSLTRVSSGLFIAPYDPGGRRKDSFLVSVAGPDGAGDAMAEISFVPPKEMMGQTDGEDTAGRLLLVIASTALGLLVGALAMRWWPIGRARARTA